MRKLLLTRGMPGSGKSTWIARNNLQPYTLSADSIRLLMQSPITNLEGQLRISQKNDGKVWSLLMEVLEQRMERGEFVVVDGTHYKAELLQRYKQLIDKYRYRAYIVDFTDVSLETCLERNKQRDEYKFVPEDVLIKMHSVFEAEKDSKACKEISNKFTVLNHESAIDLLNEELLYDFSNDCEKVVVFGDIHACYQPISNYFEKHPFNENYKYIFTGDYLDRGVQNAEMIRFLSEMRTRNNVLLLEGNHEKHLRKYCDKHYKHFTIDNEEDKKIIRKYIGRRKLNSLFDNNIRSREFLNNTIPQIEKFDKSELRQICRKFAQFAYFKFGDKKYLITHGGLPSVPSIFTSTQELIDGVGGYEEEETVYQNWCKNNIEGCVQIHAHRNIFDNPVKYDDNFYNLCDKPEFGGKVRIIEIDKNGNIEDVSEKNNIFNENLNNPYSKIDTINSLKTDNELLDSLNKSKFVKKKILDDGIISYNFSRDVFYKNIWNDVTCKARGLFVDKSTEQVVARGYDKFFLWGQTDACKSSALKKNMQFPVNIYRKENGFLGLVSFNKNTGKLFVASKSTNNGDFADMIRDELDKLDKSVVDNIVEYSKNNNCTFIFECINQDKDPHIIRYNGNRLILLDIVKNTFKDEYLPYEVVKEFADNNNIECKILDYTFNTWEELYSWKHQVEKDYSFEHEGWVIQDSNNFRVKLKTPFYVFWKFMRSVKESICRGSNKRPSFKTNWEIEVYNYMRTLPIDLLQNKCIIDIREDFLSRKDNNE